MTSFDDFLECFHYLKSQIGVKTMNNFVLINIPDLRSRKFAGKSALQFDWFDLK